MPARPRGVVRPIAHRDTSTWGKRLQIRPGVLVAGGGTGIGPDIGIRQRLIDVRAPTSRPGVISAPFVVYVTAKALLDPNLVVNRRATFARFLQGVLETGSGGITRQESFVVPQHGRAIHIGADSVRLYALYLPLNEQPPNPVPDGLAAMTGFDLNANASMSGLYPGEVRVATEPFSSALIPPTDVQTFPIPEFSETLELSHPSLSSFDVTWRDVFGAPLDDTPVMNGTAFQCPCQVPVPLAATQVEIQYNGPAGPPSSPGMVLKWFRPS